MPLTLPEACRDAGNRERRRRNHAKRGRQQAKLGITFPHPHEPVWPSGPAPDCGVDRCSRHHLFDADLAAARFCTAISSKQSGLTLLPALVLLTGASCFIKSSRTPQEQAKAVAAEPRRREGGAARRRARAAGHLRPGARRSLDFDSHPRRDDPASAAVAGTEHVWVLVQQGAEWDALAGDTRGARGRAAMGRPRGAAARRRTDKTADQPHRSRDRVSADRRRQSRWACSACGPCQAASCPSDRKRILEAAAALLAVSVKNAQLFREVRENSVRDALTGCFTRGHCDGDDRRRAAPRAAQRRCRCR